MLVLTIFYVIAAAVSLGLVIAVFNISSHAAKHTSLLTFQVRMLAKIAKQQGVPEDELKALLKEMLDNID